MVKGVLNLKKLEKYFSFVKKRLAHLVLNFDSLSSPNAN
jgi:hypothetical protein